MTGLQFMQSESEGGDAREADKRQYSFLRVNPVRISGFDVCLDIFSSLSQASASYFFQSQFSCGSRNNGMNCRPFRDIPVTSSAANCSAMSGRLKK